jgi:hypothetical protein
MSFNTRGPTYRTTKNLHDVEHHVELYNIDGAGVVVTLSEGKAPGLSRIFTAKELKQAALDKSIESFQILVNSLEIVENEFVPNAVQIGSTLQGINAPEPILSQQAAMSYLTNSTVGLSKWNSSSDSDKYHAQSQLLMDVVAKGLTELCRYKPQGLDAIKWLGEWFLNNNPSQPNVHVEED